MHQRDFDSDTKQQAKCAWWKNDYIGSNLYFLFLAEALKIRDIF